MFLAALLLCQVALILGFPQGDSEMNLQANGRAYKRPLSAISPDDMRGPNGEITGLYTQVSPKERWPNATVYWEWDAALNNFTAEEKAIIKKGMEEIQNETCIVFKEKTTETAYISYKNDVSGCWATAGYQGKKQSVNMEKGCFGDTSTLIHEVMHALGLHHEQTRYDRDMFVEVQWSNIETKQTHNFDKYPRTFAYPKYLFDMNSVMMYSLDSFGIGGRPSMVLTFKNATLDENTIGKATKMSKTDIYRMRSAYKCDVQGEGARQPSRVASKGNKNKKKGQKFTKKNGQKFTKKTGKLSRVALRTLF